MSGAHKARRARFLERHPHCCFCGGARPTETEDHIPARGLFFGRLWPEGFVFPACAECNNGSSFDELLLSWMCRVRMGGYSPEEEREFEKTCLELSRRAPELWAAIKPRSRIQTKELLRQVTDRAKLAKVTDVLHAVSLPQDLFDASDRYGKKLAKALHYLHTGQIVPASGVVKVRSFSNTESLSGEFPKRFVAALGGRPEIRRANNFLDGQFTYRYAIAEGGEASAFAVVFGESLVILILVFCDRDRYEAQHGAQARRSEGQSGPKDPDEPSS